jgi:hypothetical protein
MNALTARLKAYYDAAMSQFNETTESEHGRFAVDAAIYTLSATELRYRTALRSDRSLFCLEGLDKKTNRGRRR